MKKSNISEIIEDIKKGKMVIIVDDESRENEGDLICAADLVTPEIINFMASKGKGLICLPMSKDLCEKYENLLLEYRAGSSIAGHAILGPYAPGSDGITRNNTDHRSGGYFNY